MQLVILVAYATKHGSTREVAETIAERLRVHGMATDVRAAGNVAGLEAYDGVVLGSAIYMGRLHEDARVFLRRYRGEFAARPVAVYAMGPRTLDEKDVAGARKQLDAALATEPTVRPLATAVFGGAFDPGEHHFPLNRMPASDVRDWSAIGAWADEVAACFGRREAFALT